MTTKKSNRQQIKQTGLFVCLCLVILLLPAGCSQEETSDRIGIEQVAVTFNTVLSSRTVTDGNEWSDGDDVGVFMLTTGGLIPENLVHAVTIGAADNYKYTISDAATGTLSAVSDDMYYPQSQEVDFIAYYPYGDKGTISGEINPETYHYIVDITNQNDPASLDILYAKVIGAGKSKTPVTLSFMHVMSKITLNIKLESGLSAESVMVTGMPVMAELDLQEGKVIAGMLSSFNMQKATTPTNGYDATFTAILIPQTANEYSARTVTFTVNGTGYIWKIQDRDDFEAGNNYIYSVTIKRDGISTGHPDISSWNQNDNGTAAVSKMINKKKF